MENQNREGISIEPVDFEEGGSIAALNKRQSLTRQERVNSNKMLSSAQKQEVLHKMSQVRTAGEASEINRHLLTHWNELPVMEREAAKQLKTELNLMIYGTS